MFGSIGMPELIIIFVIASDHLRAPEAAGTGPFPRQEPRRIQARVERAEEHARRGNPARGTAVGPRGIEGEGGRAGRGGRSRRDRRRPPHRRSKNRSRRERPTTARKPHLSWPWCPFQAPSRGPMRLLTNDEDDDPLAPGAKMSFLEHLDELRKRIVRSCLAVGVRRSRDVLLDSADLQFHSRADAPGAAARRQADLHAAGRSVLALHHRRPDRGRRRRRAVHHVSGLDVHRARPVLERKADGVSRSCSSRRSASSPAPRSTTTCRSRS